MEEQFSYRPDGNLLLSFPNFSEWMRFCRFCLEKDIPVVKDTNTMSAMVSSEVFNNLPKNFRDGFEIQNSEITKRLLAERKKPNRIRRRTPPPMVSKPPVDEQKIIDQFLPATLMPHVK